MLACEENLEFHLANIEKYPKAEISVDIPTAKSSVDFSSWEDSRFERDIYGGESSQDAFGLTRDFNLVGSIDYYRLRKLSRQLFTENMYAASIVGRLNTNIINDGLKLEADPSQFITKMNDDEHTTWTSEIEAFFDLWASDKSVDYKGVHDLSGLEKVGFDEVLIEGDVLKRTRFDEKTGLPRIELIAGRHVQTAPNSNDIAAKGNRVQNGVEIDKAGRHIAYHVVVDNELGISFDAVRIPAKGRTSSRETATLVYYSPPPVGRTRGFPLLTRIIQPLAQIGRYSSYELKAAEITSSLALWVEKTKDVQGEFNLGPTLKTNKNPDPKIADCEVPRQSIRGGVVINELAYGEKPHSFDTSRPNINFPAFKKSILQDIAAAIGIPPEVLLLMFENSFSASRQATIEFKALVMRDRAYFSKQFNKEIYGQFLLGMVMNGKIKAPGYKEAIKGGEIFGTRGWQKCRFTGFIKQNVDILKEAKAYVEYINEGLMDRDQAAMELTGADHATVVKRLKKQNPKLADARDSLLGEINTSISRVEGKEPKEPKQPKQPKQRMDAREISDAVGLAVYEQVIALMGGDVNEDLESVNTDIDEMDNEKDN